MVSGTVAAIRWHYYDAATIHGYTITRAPGTRQWLLSANIITADPFKLSQQPLRLVVPHKGGAWTWPIVGPVPRSCGPFRTALGTPSSSGTVANVHMDPSARISPP